ncbi:MAG: hemerythrin domain-containing protein [Candidatus Sericytochromatia bacterium]
MNGYDVLFEHHDVLRGLCKKITAAAPDSDEREHALDELLLELDIHMRIEDDLFYPAVSAASRLVAIAHAEHRQVWEQLTALLRTSPTAPKYEDEWQSFVTVLDAHADEEERDLCPPPVDLSEDMLDALGDEMVGRMEQLRESRIEKLHVKGRAALLRAMP